jgi:Flp pilus assembly protein TadG
MTFLPQYVSRRQPARRHQQRKGATAVEFAIVAPVFFVLLLTSIEFSRLNVIRHSADEAAYEGARTAMVPGATAAEAVAAANEILNIVGAKDAAVDIDPPVIDEDTDAVTVTISIPLNSNGWILPKFTRNRVLERDATLRTERVHSLGDI